MKKIELYECEKCGLKSYFESKIKDCEVSHFGLGAIEDIVYKAGSKYPSRVLVKAPDDTYHVYGIEELGCDKSPEEEWAAIAKRSVV
jgi:hypothetical protein